MSFYYMMIDAGLIFRGLTAVILIVFTIVFSVLYLYDRKQRCSAWIAIAYSCGLAAFLIDIGRPSLDAVYSDVLAKLLFWGFSIAWVAGLCEYSKVRFPKKQVVSVVSVGLILLLSFGFVFPDIILRSIFSTMTAGLILAAGLPSVWKTRQHGIDNMLCVLTSILCATYFLRPLIAYGYLNEIYTAATYGASTYAAMLHAVAAFCGLALGVTMLLAIGYRIILKHQIASTKDPLTGLLNRRGLEQFVETDLVLNFQNNAAIVILDLDHFKQVNDRFGHDAGDQVLIRTTTILRTFAVEFGTMARIGGEEFVIVLGGMDIEDCLTVAQHLRLSLAMLNHPEIGPDRKVTASMGIAKLSAQESFAMSLRRADQALYRAKAEGRNRVAVASEQLDVEPIAVAISA